MIRYGFAAVLALGAAPAIAETGLLDPQGREITLERLWDRLAAAPTRDPEFDAGAWRDGADAVAASSTEQVLASSGFVAYPPSEPITVEERTQFVATVSQCFLAPDDVVENDVVVTVGFRLDPRGYVVGNVVLLATNLRDEPLTLLAYRAARLAILRCQRTGYQLPDEKYERWQDVEITFDPAQMATR